MRLAIFDASGGRVRTLDPGTLAAGSYTIPWDARDGSGRRVATGVYYCRFETGAVRESRAIVYLR